MWFQLNTTFSTHLGALSTLQSNYGVIYSLSNFTKTTAPDMVKKNDPLTVVLKMVEGATFTSATMTDGTTSVTGTLASSDSTVTMTITQVKGPVTVIARAASASVEEPEDPVTPTNYTFTINPTPTSATVTLSATGYSTVSGTGSKSITVANGTKVNWSVSADGYTTRTGNWTISGGNKTENITLTASDGSNIAYYIVNKNLWSDGELQDFAGRIAITTYFPTNGKELSVSTSIPGVTTIAKRYYNTEKVGGVTAAESAYGRCVLVLGTTALDDIYAGQTITVNGTVYTLQTDPSFLPKTVTYVTKANIGADGEVVENYSEFRVAILDYFETGGAAVTASSSLGGVAVRYYDANKIGGATADASTYARAVIHTIATENQNDAAIEGAALTINGKAYILSNN